MTHDDEKCDTEPADRYNSRGCAVVRGVLSEDVAAALTTRLGERGQPGSEIGRLELYGDPEFDSVLERLSARVGEIARIDALPTYSFAREYAGGEVLKLHRDRPACEHSISIHLGSATGPAWPLWMRDGRGDRISADLEPGDGVFYRGIELQHWRRACPVAWYSQAFFHYVDANGPHAAERYDRRPRLGLPASAKRTDARGAR